MKVLHDEVSLLDRVQRSFEKQRQRGAGWSGFSAVVKGLSVLQQKEVCSK